MELYKLFNNGSECTFSIGKLIKEIKIFKPIYELENDILVDDVLQIFESDQVIKVTHFDYSEKYIPTLKSDGQVEFKNSHVILPIIKPKITYYSREEFLELYNNHYLKLIDEL